MRRRADWVARLVATVDQWRDRPFAYGSNDCVRFAAECVEAMTGKVYETPYRTRREAVRLIRNAGGLSALMTSRLGPPRDGQPRRGDVCLVTTADGDGVGVAIGAVIAVPGDRGLGFYPVTAARLTWRV